jgi:PAS domain S-box-containing protein
MKTILVVDDDKYFRKAVATSLRRAGYDVIESGDGADGLALASTKLPSLVLSDVNMAGQNGFELLNALRARVETAAIPVIMMTGEPQDADVRFSMEQGADDYLAKPFAMEALLSAVAARLRRADINQAVQAQQDVERLSAEKKIQLQTSALEAAANGIVITKRNGKILWVNHAFTKLTGYNAEEVIGQNPRILKSDRHPAKFYGDLWATILGGNIWQGELVNRRKDGSFYDEAMTITPVGDEHGVIQNFIAIKQDVSERKRLEVQLSQSQKLETVGQLAAGIAHEINTPTQYVGDNTRFVKDSFEAISQVLCCHEELLAAARQNAVTPELLARHEKILADSDLDYLREQIPSALEETLEGVERVSKIVRAMKDFSHPCGKDKIPADLNRAIESTVTVARNEWKYVADLKLELEPDLPLVPSLLGEFNQSILNLVVNAAHAIGDVVKKNPGAKGCITVRTQRDGDHVEVRVSDTGTGIAEANRKKIFEPFFTTKEVGKGTGQGLSIVYGSIVKRHGGTVTFETEVGKGTTFIIRLPLKPQTSTAAKSPATLERHAA